MMLGESWATLPAYPTVPQIGLDQNSKNLNSGFPEAIEGDAVIIAGPGDGQELWVKIGSGWMRGDMPGQTRMTMEYRPSYKRIIFDQFDLAPPNIQPVSQKRGSIVGSYPPNYAAYAALAVVAFLALRGLR
jgi:hypothetical protein